MSFSFSRALALAIMVLLGLSACTQANLRTDTPSDARLRNWPQRLKQLNAIRQWDVSGRIAMQTTDDAWSASMSWKQIGNDYDIRLFGPLGGKALSIKGSEDYVFLTTDKGETFSDVSAVRLIYRQTGWQVPVEGLRYWARALAAPEAPSRQVFDQVGRLSELHQSDWTIYYQDYRIINNLEMPRKMRMVNEHFTVKLVLRDWQLARKTRQNDEPSLDL